MDVLHYRRIHRQEYLSNNDEFDQDDYEDSESSIGYLSTSTENPYDKATTIGEEVTKKVSSKYKEDGLLKEKIRIT